MGKYFGRQPRYSQEEAEAQAKQALDAAVSRGRPPAEEWAGLQGRMGEISRELATRPRVDLPPPPPRPTERRPVNQILRPRPQPEPEPEPAVPPPARKPVVRKAAPAKASAAAPAVKRAPAVKKAPTTKKAPAVAKAPAPKRAPAKKRSS